MSHAFDQYADELSSKLYPNEIGWRDRQPFLASRGYMLRPRYHPDWIPSWRSSGKHPYYCEDSVCLPFRPSLIDATRVSDGMLVYIKRVQTDDQESRIAAMLSSPLLRQDPTNHCVPILELIQDPDYETESYMVMPFLRLMDDPPCECVDDVLDFGEQILEGLVFLHKHGVAHRDCSQKNLMMDATPLYPRGFHPVNDNFLPDGTTPAWPYPLSRTDHPVKYYFVDFGISVHIPPDVQPKLALGAYGRDQDPPELSFDVPYDPFKLDIFIMGNLFRREFHAKYSNVDFLQPVFEPMIQAEPSARRDADEALRRWRAMRAGIGYIQRRWRLRPREDSWAEKMVFDTGSLLKTGMHLTKSLVSWSAGMLPSDI